MTPSPGPDWYHLIDTKKERAAMLSQPLDVNNVSQAIQLALGPVFLLTGIAGMLNVMTGRLSRIIDRGRRLAEGVMVTEPKVRESVNDELRELEHRRHLASAAITACTLAALLVCTVVTALFVEVMFHAPLEWLVGALFTGATLALVVGLAFFLREVRLATRSIRIPIAGPKL
jgi:MFS family permease